MTISKRRAFAFVLVFFAVGLAWAAPVEKPSNAYNHYLKALLYESQGNLVSAEKEIDKALELEQDSARLFRMKAEVSFFLGRLKVAQVAIDRANELNPNDTKAHLLAGQIYWSLGDIQTAEDRLTTAVELSPDETQPLVSLAMAVTARDPERAIKLYKDFLKRHPGETEVQERLAQLYRSQGDVARSKKAWKKALEWSPDSLRAHLALAQIAEVDSDTTTAIVHYQAVLNKDPTNLPLLLRVGELRYRNNEMSEAYEAFSQAKQVAPESASANFWMALLHEHRGEWKQAIELLDKVAKKSPEPGVLLRQAYYYTQLGEHQKAVVILKGLAQEEPENTDFLNYLAIAYEQLKNYKKADETVDQLLDIDPLNPEYHFFKGTLNDRMGKFEKTEEALAKAIELDPDFAMALNYLGYSYADRNEKLELAEKYLVRAVTLDPDRSAFLDSLGWVYYRLGKYDEAADYLQKAALKGNDSLIWDHLADVRIAQNQPSQALLALDESLRLDSNQPKVRKKAKKLLSKISEPQRFSLYVKRGTANFEDTKSIKGLVKVQVCRKGRCFDGHGEFEFQQEKEFKIEIPGPLAGPILMVSKQYGKPVQYGALHPLFQTAEPQVKKVFERMELILTGQLFRSINTDEFKNQSKKKGKLLISNHDGLSVTFSEGSGYLKKVRWKKDAEETLAMGNFSEKTWPRLPQQYKWNDKDSGITIQVNFKDPVIRLRGTTQK